MKSLCLHGRYQMLKARDINTRAVTRQATDRSSQPQSGGGSKARGEDL